MQIRAPKYPFLDSSGFDQVSDDQIMSMIEDLPDDLQKGDAFRQFELRRHSVLPGMIGQVTQLGKPLIVNQFLNGFVTQMIFMNHSKYGE